MDFRLDLSLHSNLESPIVLGLPGEIDISTPEEYKCNSNGLNGFDELLSESNLIKKPQKDPDVWSGSKVPLLLSFMEELGPKIRASSHLNNKHKAWLEIQRRFEEAGYTMTAKQISNKYGSLMRQYESVMQYNKNATRKKKCFYRRELERVKAVWPRILRESHSGDDSISTSGMKVAGDEEVEEHSCWYEHRVKYLLSCIEELLPQVGDSSQFKRKIDMWQEVVRRLQAKGYQFSMQQVINKYAALLRQYRKTKTRCKPNGEPVSCPFKEEIEAILAKRKVVNDEMEKLENFEDVNCNTYDSFLADYEQLDPTNISSSFEIERLENSPSIEDNGDGKFKLKEMKESYYKERIEYYQRKKTHLQRKEEHMKKKEALLESILSQLECKMYSFN